MQATSVASGKQLARTRPVPFHRVCRRTPAFLLILFCFVTRPTDCQTTREQQSPPAANTSATSNTLRPISFSRDGLTISNKNGTSQVRLHGYVEADGRFFTTDLKDRQHNVLLFRRVRPIIEGTLGSSLRFRFMPDFREGKTVIQDVFVEWDPLSAAKLRVGKFKTPFGLEMLRSNRDLTFSERSLASDLIPNRDLGAQVEGSVLQHAVTYELGYFSGTADGTSARFKWRGTNEGVVRAFFQPFTAAKRAPLRQLGAGIAISGGHSHGALPSFKTIGQQTFFQYTSGAIADGRHKRVSPQAYYYFKQFEVLAEYVTSGQTVAVGSAHRYLSNDGWEVSGSIVLTGEKGSYEGIRPAHPFNPAAGLQNLGAWQIAFRHSVLDVDANAFPQYAVPTDSARRANELAVGLNWYVNRHTKVMADYEYTTFRMITPSIPHLSPERVVMARLQFAF